MAQAQAELDAKRSLRSVATYNKAAQVRTLLPAFLLRSLGTRWRHLHERAIGLL